MGYLNRESETRECLTDSGWLRLGDLGGTDPDGFLVAHGRAEEGDVVTLRSGEVILPQKVREYWLRMKSLYPCFKHSVSHR